MINKDNHLTDADLPVMVIRQGRATPSYFHILQPVPGIELFVDQPVTCINPKTKREIRGIVTQHYWTFSWEEVSKGWILGIWGVDPIQLRKVAMMNDPGFSDTWARAILIKELD
jgi:hypothetical protein